MSPEVVTCAKGPVTSFPESPSEAVYVNLCVSAQSLRQMGDCSIIGVSLKLAWDSQPRECPYVSQPRGFVGPAWAWRVGEGEAQGREASALVLGVLKEVGGQTWPFCTGLLGNMAQLGLPLQGQQEPSWTLSLRSE